MELSIQDETVVLDPERLAALEAAVFAGEGRTLRVSLGVVGDAEIQRVNREFLDHDWETDVIAFDLADDASGAPDDLDGEILVNAQQAAREGATRRHGPEAELLFYVAHGLLHLLGYDDASPEDRQDMHARQATYLAHLGIEIDS